MNRRCSPNTSLKLTACWAQSWSQWRWATLTTVSKISCNNKNKNIVYLAVQQQQNKQNKWICVCVALNWCTINKNETSYDLEITIWYKRKRHAKRFEVNTHWHLAVWNGEERCLCSRRRKGEIKWINVHTCYCLRIARIFVFCGWLLHLTSSSVVWLLLLFAILLVSVNDRFLCIFILVARPVRF